MYVRGVTGKNGMPLTDFRNNNWGIAFCKQVMSKDCFKEIFQFLRFNKKSSLSEKLQTDKFALFSTVLNRFIENCIAWFKPGVFLKMDEQLLPCKARCPFTLFMASKSDKYGKNY